MNMFSLEKNAGMNGLSKAELTRVRIYEAAMGLFVTEGYERTTMRQIAAESESSLGLAYRYFGSKEEFVLEFYRGLAGKFCEHVAELPQGGIAERFAAAMEYKLGLVEPHLELIGVLMSAAMNPQSRVAVLGEGTLDIREQMQRGFAQIVSDAENSPGEKGASALAKVLYVAHLGLLFFRVHDRSEGGRATRDLVKMVESALNYMPMALKMPIFGDGLEKIAKSMDAVFWRTQP